MISINNPNSLTPNLLKPTQPNIIHINIIHATRRPRIPHNRAIMLHVQQHPRRHSRKLQHQLMPDIRRLARQALRARGKASRIRQHGKGHGRAGVGMAVPHSSLVSPHRFKPLDHLGDTGGCPVDVEVPGLVGIGSRAGARGGDFLGEVGRVGA